MLSCHHLLIVQILRKLFRPGHLLSLLVIFLLLLLLLLSLLLISLLFIFPRQFFSLTELIIASVGIMLIISLQSLLIESGDKRGHFFISTKMLRVSLLFLVTLLQSLMVVLLG